MIKISSFFKRVVSPNRAMPPMAKARNDSIKFCQKTLAEAMAHHEILAAEYSRSLQNSILQLNGIVKSNNKELQSKILQYPGLLQHTSSDFADKSSSNESLFRDYVTGLYLIQENMILRELNKLGFNIAGDEEIDDSVREHISTDLSSIIERLTKKTLGLKERSVSAGSIFSGASKHELNVHVSFGRHFSVMDAVEFKTLIDRLHPDIIIDEQTNAPQYYNYFLSPEFIKENTEYFDDANLSFFKKLTINLINESSGSGPFIRTVEHMPFSDMLQSTVHSAHAKEIVNARVPQDKMVENGFMGEKEMWLSADIRNKWIIENIGDILSCFELYYPHLSQKKTITMLVRYGSAHYVLENKMMSAFNADNIRIISEHDRNTFGTFKILDEFKIMERLGQSEVYDGDLANRIFLLRLLDRVSLHSFHDLNVFNMFSYTFVKRAKIDRVLALLGRGLSPTETMNQELGYIRIHESPDGSMKKILREDFPEERSTIDRLRDID